MQLHYIDLFCGAGGTTSGIEEAHFEQTKCADVIACVNHDPNAIASHLANHPKAVHFTEDIRTLDLSPIVELVRKLRKDKPEDKIVLWGSLECTNFSNAKGGQPRDPDSRTLAEHLYRYIEEIDPDYIQIENVREFMCWGKLDESGKPVSRDRGSSYIRWVNRIKRYGYDFDRRILNSANYGAYTSRERFFGIFARKGLPIAFPEPTHAREADGGLFGESFRPWRKVSEVLDLEDEGQSIFNRKKPLVDATLRRIMAGLEKFITPKGERRFLIKNFSGEESSKCISTEQPAGTITCKDHHSLVSVQRFIDNQYGTGRPTPVSMPCTTILNNPKQNLVTVSQCIMVAGYSWPKYGIDRPCPTIIAHQDKSPIYFISQVHGENLQDDPDDSQVMKELKEYCRRNGISDIRMRQLNINELKRIMGFPEDYVLIGTQSQQKKYIGNAVEVNTSRCLCESLYRSLTA